MSNLNIQIRKRRFKLTADRIEKLIKRNLSPKSRCVVHPNNSIQILYEDRKANYPEFTVLIDLLGSDGQHVKLIRLEIDYGGRSVGLLAPKICRMSGMRLTLCPNDKKIQSLKAAIALELKGDMTKTDGMIFGSINNFLFKGLMGTFRTFEGNLFQFTTPKLEERK